MGGNARPMNQDNYNTAVLMNKKSEALAIVLSFLIPGVGEMYAGKVGKGVVILLLAIISAVLMIFIIGVFLYLIIWIYSMIDSYNLVKQYNIMLMQNNGQPPW